MSRLFVGIMLPQDIAGKIASLQKDVAKMPIECKLVERENMHISLSFLGDVEKVKEVITKLEQVAKYGKFSVDIKNLLLIPNENFIRVIALDVVDINGKMEELRLGVVGAVGGKSYRAHVTLCRIKSVGDKGGFKKMVAPLMQYVAGSLEVGSFQLIESRLSKTGPVYEIVSSFSLE